MSRAGRRRWSGTDAGADANRHSIIAVVIGDGSRLWGTYPMRARASRGLPPKLWTIQTHGAMDAPVQARERLAA
jgi:hypothetical protein